MERRSFITTSLAASVAPSALLAKDRALVKTTWDLIVIGAGTAGIPAAIFASYRGAKVLMIDAATVVGGTLHLAGGEISGAGTRAQAAKGIKDSADIHFDDVMRLSHNNADPIVTRLTVDRAGAMLNWLLDNGLVPLAEHPVTGENAFGPGYSVARYLWGKNNGRDILAVMEQQLAPEIRSGRVTTLLDTKVTALLTSDQGTVNGVRTTTNGVENTYRGRHVILTTGGYAMNPELFQQLIGQPNYVAGSYPTARGDGLGLATSVGAALRGRELHRPGTGSVLTADQYPAKVYARFDTLPSIRAPWEIWVNTAGQRFIAEDKSDSYKLANLLNEQPKFKYAIVFDEAILAASPVGIPGWTKDKMREHFGAHPMFHRADTLNELAAKAGIDAKGLKDTVTAYNAGVGAKSDSMGRQHLPLPIAKAPYYAIIHLGHSATSSVGMVVDQQLRALRANGEPIKGLYAAGEVLGSGATLGNAFVPGMMITPAMTLGRLLGDTLPLRAF